MGAWPLAALLLVASTGAKASSVPVVAGALGLTALILLVVRRRLAWPVIVAGVLALAAQGFATAILFAFESHGVIVDPFSGLRPFVGTDAARPAGTTALLWIAVAIAFLLNLQLRLAGIVALVRYRRFRLEPVQLFLLGGALVGPAIYLLVGHPGSSNQYFNRAGFAFGVIASAWGYAEVLERARLSRRARVLLAVGAAGFAVILSLIQFDQPGQRASHARLGPGPATALVGRGARRARRTRGGALAGTGPALAPAARSGRGRAAHRHPGRRGAGPGDGRGGRAPVPQRRRVRGGADAAVAGVGGPLGVRAQRPGRRGRHQRALPGGGQRVV